VFCVLVLVQPRRLSSPEIIHKQLNLNLLRGGIRQTTRKSKIQDPGGLARGIYGGRIGGSDPKLRL
jgi:hypothetical protein